jgi:DNA segregation ATPase FtsK/SpoIIIE, S-DNA-T family
VRLTVTIVDPSTDQRADIVLESDGQTPIRAVAGEFAAVLGRDVNGGAMSLFVDGVALEADETLHGSAIREGSVISLDDASGCPPLDPPPGPSPAVAAVEPSSDGAALDYNRAPRLLAPLRQTRFRLPAKPREQDRRPLPIVMAIAPLIMAGVMVLVFGRWYFVIFALLSPVSLIGSHLHDKRSGRKSHRKLLAEYRETKAAIEADATSALSAERIARRTTFPDPATVLLTAVGPGRRLWERRRHDADALTIRVGTGDVDSEVVLDDPDQLEHRREQTWTAQDVPVIVSLRERGVLGLAGRADFPRAMARWVVAQAAVLHTPADLRIYVLTDERERQSWQWLCWLPHARPADGQDTVTLIGSDTDSTACRLAELVQIVACRRAASSPGAVLDEPDVLVVLDGARRLRSLPGMVQVLREGPSVGVFAVCVDCDERLLPEECQAVVVQEATGVRVQQMRTDVVGSVHADLVSPAWCDRVARALAPLRDVSGDSEETALPPAGRLLDVLGLEPPRAEDIIARWALCGRSTEAVIGESRDGQFSLDVRRDGPHGLIAGTTGAGKSELLQSLVASLAVANRPDALTFVLIDYKGGAAFAHCERLPHTVGMVTDLDSHLVERALESLGAELRRREHQLAAVGAKDIDDYVDLLHNDPSIVSMPRLVIVIDEFASMARELPDFVTGLVNIAQRGRSLGIHLILATQRPSGIVSPEIRANTNLRIALRVTDTTESSDVIDAPDAARISKATPGRAYARLGHSSLVAFQTGRVGGRRPGIASPVTLGPWAAEVDWLSLGRSAPVRPTPSAVADQDVTDLQVLVEALRAAAAIVGVPRPRSPWLPALPDRLLLDDLAASGVAAALGADLPVAAFGLEDLPSHQVQRPAVIDLATFSHLYVVGAPRSGRSQTLRSIAGSLARTWSSADVHLYGIDCGNGALLPLVGLPHCGAVVSRTQPERASRLILRLAAEVRRRQELFALCGWADLSEQRAAQARDERLAHVVVLLDRWEGFVTTLGEIDSGRLTEEIYVLLREGASVGVHLVLAGDRSLVSGRMATFTDEKLVLRLADRGDLSLVGIDPRRVPDELPAGRAFRAESGIETQIALLGPDPTAAGQSAALAEIAARAGARDSHLPGDRRPFRVDVLPARPTFDQAWQLRPHTTERPLWGLVGVGGDELHAHGVELTTGARSFVVGGPPRSGRSTVLLTMARSFLLGGASLVVVTPRPSPLVELDGVPGVLAVLKAGDVPPDELTAALDRAPGPCVVLMDDAELLRDCSAADVLRRVMRSGPDRPQGLVLAGNADDICTGFSGWQVDAKKSRRGALLSPQGTTDGDLIGVRLPRSAVGGAVHPGRALVHLGDSHLQTLAVPLIAAADFRAWTVSPAGLWPAARPPAGRSARPGRGSAPSRRDPGWSGGLPR